MYSAAVILPVAVAEPKLMDEKPFVRRPSSVSVKCRSPVASVPRPIVVVAVFGAIVSVEVPVIEAPISKLLVVIVKAFTPILIAPLAPMLTVPPVILVAPNTLDPPTTPLIATVAVPALIPTVLADVPSKLLIVPLKVMLLLVVEKTVFCLINTELLKV